MSSIELHSMELLSTILKFIMCDKGFIWNSSNCECECDKLCDIGEYRDYKNCKCRKKIIDKLIEKCSENIYENKVLYNETFDIISSSVNNKTTDSCIVYIVLFSVFLIINISMAIYVYFFLSLKNRSPNSHCFWVLKYKWLLDN